jgi:wyosine [tRNA(Phe)-imidazoG37] synthetase (radical SAM superfamily)
MKTFWLKEDKLTDLICVAPFTRYEILDDGKVHMCCPSWLDDRAGNVLENTVDEIINNPVRLATQQAFLNNTEVNCNHHCPMLNEYKETSIVYPPLYDTSSSSAAQILDSTLYYVNFNYDRSCNLQCPSCRSSLIMIDPINSLDATAVRIKNIHENSVNLINTLLATEKSVIVGITGSGDPFASHLYWNYLVELSKNPPKNLWLHLHTNGILMTADRWQQIKPLWPQIKLIYVSIDAATESTYRIVRKNGNFRTLTKNLEVLDNMILSNNFPNLVAWISLYTVQLDNYHETADFAKWHESYKSYKFISYTRITQWPHLTDQQFESMAVWKPEHPKFADFIKILDDPIFKSNPKIILGDLTHSKHM